MVDFEIFRFDDDQISDLRMIEFHRRKSSNRQILKS